MTTVLGLQRVREQAENMVLAVLSSIFAQAVLHQEFVGPKSDKRLGSRGRRFWRSPCGQQALFCGRGQTPMLSQIKKDFWKSPILKPGFLFAAELPDESIHSIGDVERAARTGVISYVKLKLKKFGTLELLGGTLPCLTNA
ncbi:MAG: hypothetical protein HYY78_13730 [Betaproteobacteria bacterium]|nr:hypothetical protein [Betaproteobacteria bacterium]